MTLHRSKLALCGLEIIHFVVVSRSPHVVRLEVVSSPRLDSLHFLDSRFQLLDLVLTNLKFLAVLSDISCNCVS